MYTEDAYDNFEITFSTPKEDLEVLSGLMFDFESIKDHNFDLLSAVKFQGQEKFFDHLQGPLFPHLVIEFWIHAKTSTCQIASFVFGKKIVITEKLIAKLIENDESSIRHELMGERRYDQVEMAKSIFTTGSHANKIKNTHSDLRIWARILFRCVNHRKPTNSPDYINFDQQYVLHFIDANKKVNLPGLLFRFLRDIMK